MNSLSYSIIYSACFALIVNCAAAQNVYTVGDSIGWISPPNTSFYSTWTSGKTFMVNDTLVFNFTTSFHNVFQVPKASYDNCSIDGYVGSYLVGPANVTLNSTGDRHYICSVSTHCLSGQKLSITVINSASTPGGATAPPPPMTPPPPTTTTTTPLPASPKAGSSLTPPPPTSPPPPPPPPMPSSSVSLGGSFFIITMCAALALIV